jgi:hypothetical protein
MDIFDIMLIISLLVCLTIMIYLGGANDGYKKGQIDAINGEIHYQLEKQPNGETEWARIKNE